MDRSSVPEKPSSSMMVSRVQAAPHLNPALTQQRYFKVSFATDNNKKSEFSYFLARSLPLSFQTEVLNLACGMLISMDNTSADSWQSVRLKNPNYSFPVCFWSFVPNSNYLLFFQEKMISKCVSSHWSRLVFSEKRVPKYRRWTSKQCGITTEESQSLNGLHRS